MMGDNVGAYYDAQDALDARTAATPPAAVPAAKRPTIMRVRCPKAAEDRPHLSVDIGQPLPMAKLASLIKAVSRCVCGAEMVIEAPAPETP